MDFRRALLGSLAPLIIFACGGLAWMALDHGLYATALSCLGAALYAASRIGAPGPQRRERPLGLDRRFTADLGRQRLSALLDQSPSPMLLQDGDGGLYAVNRAARALFDCQNRLPSPDRALKVAFDTAETLAPFKLGAATYSLGLSEIDDGRAAQRLGVLTDISAEVRAAEANALREVLQILNHELLNALTPITSLAQTAADLLRSKDAAAHDKARRAIDLVAQRAGQLNHFVDSYRALSRLPEPNRRNLDVEAWLSALRPVVEAQWPASRVRLDWRVDPPAPPLRLDAEQMAQALLNMLLNAGEAAMAHAAAPQVRFSLHAANGRAAFAIEDNGPGVADDQRETIFQPFHSTKATGGGVGLSLAKQIVAAHGAQLRVERSESLGGARFVFSLPMGDA